MLKETKPLRPYLLNAFIEWCNVNNGDCHIVVQANYPGTEVPPAFVKNNLITLRIRIDAVAHWLADDQHLSFSARFSGASFKCHIPMGSIVQVFDKITGTKFPFAPEPGYLVEFSSGEKVTPHKRPTLSVVK